jgi:hypothetical protein
LLLLAGVATPGGELSLFTRLGGRVPMNRTVAGVVEAFAALRADLSQAGASYRTGSGSLVPLSDFAEMRNAFIVVRNPRRRLGPAGMFVPGQAVARFFWHLFGYSSLESIAAYCGHVDRFANADGELLGSSYGRKIFGSEDGAPSQYEMASHQISERPNTKRAFIALCSRSELIEHPMDFACAIGLQMFPRDGVLHMTAFMRANNLTKLFSYNAFEFTLIQEWAAVRHDLMLGEYTHIVGSLHSYDMNRATGPVVDSGVEMAPMPKASDADLQALVELELRIRHTASDWQSVRALIGEFDKLHVYWRDMLMALLLVRLERIGAHGALRELADVKPVGPLEEMQRSLSMTRVAA